MAREANTSPKQRHIQLHLAVRRQKSGVSLEEIAESTKISMRFLRAIEEEDFGKLPGGVFNTSYIRQYAAAIGCDESEILDHYRAQTEPDKGDSSRGGASGRRRSGMGWLRSLSAI